MYEIDHRDQVSELSNVPQSSIGAPLPLVLADEHRIVLAYLLEVSDPAWDGSTTRLVTRESPEPVALVEFSWPAAHFFGPPNDEAFSGHPLAARGLHPYAAFEVHDSSWLRQLERRNRVHQRHNPARFLSLHHYIFAFHDSTFECIARGLQVSLHSGPLIALVPEMSRRLQERAPTA